MTITLQDCRALDAQDPLAPLRGHFTLPPGMIYLHGNSLGVAPKAAAALGVSYATYRDWLSGTSRTTGKPIQLPPMLGLACAALAAGLRAVGAGVVFDAPKTP